MANDIIGKYLGPFRIERRLGAGAMGAVYQAKHMKNGKVVAIKIMTPVNDRENATMAARFEREIKLLSQFQHPNIVRIFGSSDQDGMRYYAMELVEGKSLQDILDDQEFLKPRLCIAYAIQMCEALQELHRVGVIHRDLKPANIMVASDHRVKLTDFGIAKDTWSNQTQLTRADHTVGTVAFMSPEQLDGKELTRKSDLYSLGIVIYKMLTGRLPFTGETMIDFINQRMKGVYPPASTIRKDLPFDFDELIDSLLANDPNVRPHDAYQLMQKMLEIDKRIKEGTVMKTRPVAADALMETARMPNRFTTLLRSVARALPLTGRDKSKKRKREFRPFYETTWFLVLLLGCIIAIGVYGFWPMSAEQMFQRGMETAKPGDIVAMEDAMRQYFHPMNEKYPNNPYIAQVQGVQDKIDKIRADKTAQKYRKFGISADASEAARQYVTALKYDELGDKVTAAKRFHAIVKVFGEDPKERVWALLSEDQLLNETKFEKDAERIAAKRKVVDGMFEKAEDKRNIGDFTGAINGFQSIRDLYTGDADVKDLVDKAVEKLGMLTNTSNKK